MEDPSEPLSSPAEREEPNENEQTNGQEASNEHEKPDEHDQSDAHKDYHEAEDILESLFTSWISVQVAAEKLTALSLKDNDFENSVLSDWSIILGPAEKSADHHQTLSQLLIAISELPPVRDDQGNQLKLSSSRFWGKLLVY